MTHYLAWLRGTIHTGGNVIEKGQKKVLMHTLKIMGLLGLTHFWAIRTWNIYQNDTEMAQTDAESRLKPPLCNQLPGQLNSEMLVSKGPVIQIDSDRVVCF